MSAVCIVPRTVVANDAHDAVVLSKQALQLYLEKNYLVSAELYRRASRLDPKQAAYAYAAARAYHKVGHFSEAVLLYEEALKIDGPKGAYGLKAQHHLAAAHEKKGADVAWMKAQAKAQATAAKAPTSPAKGSAGAAPTLPSGAVGRSTSADPVGATPQSPGVQAPAASVRLRSAPSHALAWTAIIGGGASLVAGIVLGGLGAANQGVLRADLKETKTYRVDGATRALITLDADSATSRETAANRLVIFGWSLGAVGAAAAAVGVWRLMRPTDGLALAPMATGRGMVARWQF